jgi:hypothetical protein
VRWPKVYCRDSVLRQFPLHRPADQIPAPSLTHWPSPDTHFWSGEIALGPNFYGNAEKIGNRKNIKLEAVLRCRHGGHKMSLASDSRVQDLLGGTFHTSDRENITNTPYIAGVKNNNRKLTGALGH